ncbi:OmpH family outer membrane protein [Psychroserpens ponticola]|uniref:OmpH family outer membrane protein n=1 Tax=Psychroserpens ponticola TaxID=2932268 RepID=A0ABY7S182_9FLAO|nr:OmpH family outer membrane protein [Psychroserpens ponticola]WCO01665.1 OmpH family outer membrane protein [Psychroserpens ponticola]
MKKIIGVLSLVLILASCQEQQKIAFIDNAKVVNEYQKKVDFEKVFQVKVTAFNKKADSLGQAIQIEAQLFQTKAAKMSQKNAETEYQALLQKKQIQDYQLQGEEQKLQAEGQKQIDTLIKEVKAFVKDYGKNNGYTYILGANDAGSVMYGTDANDITLTVIDALNANTNKEE